MLLQNDGQNGMGGGIVECFFSLTLLTFSYTKYSHMKGLELISTCVSCLANYCLMPQGLESLQAENHDKQEERQK